MSLQKMNRPLQIHLKRPRSQMASKKPRIKINLREAEDRRKSTSAKDKETGDNLDTEMISGSRKKKGRKLGTGIEDNKEASATKRTGKRRGTKQK